MFGRDKNKNANSPDKISELEKAPTSFVNPVSSVIPKPVGKDGKSAKSSSTTLIARDTELFGDIKFSGSLEIEGHVVGNITANPGQDASLRILENGHVEGDVHVPRTVINGDIKGNVHASCVELAAKAKIEGNVHYETLEMLKGAQVNGSLVYTEQGVAGSLQKSS